MKGLAAVICEGYRDRLAWLRTTGVLPNAWGPLNESFISTRRYVWKILGTYLMILSVGDRY